MMIVTVNTTPVDLYTAASIAPNQQIDVQNTDKWGDLMINAGPTLPESKEDYFVLKPLERVRVQGTTVMVYGSCHLNVMVQEVLV